jgi:hypothetical protein
MVAHTIRFSQIRIWLEIVELAYIYHKGSLIVGIFVNTLTHAAVLSCERKIQYDKSTPHSADFCFVIYDFGRFIGAAMGHHDG